MLWCVMVLVGRDWVVAVKKVSNKEACELAEVIEAMGKTVRVLPW